ncbi:MAG TPA: chromosome segregation protein ScpA [Persephonella sp.]|uniref:Segregation and condensation protein A n=1 Tax=Persephonella marina (strain DSM 14350 / EX-H1) TaxID=123214 RepID=C0QQU6_PERMH|nr:MULTISPECIES: segregation/condensation protein A [Persephonella]ACO04222.1 ScpA/B protein [Persephonella marina EX-H1]HCB68792.1 chromosome segregation protein ScpA [Persephonella sp.]
MEYREKHPFDIVLKLMINGEIDPWNVDIVELADKYLNEIKNMHIPDLRLASKALAAAALLLKMKADALDIGDEQDEGEKISRKRVFGIKRFYTIDEIAHVLKKYIAPVIEFKPKRKYVRRKPYTRKPKTIDIPLFHATLEETIEMLEKEFQNLEGVITLSQLDHPNKAQAFVALLFLNYEEVINIYQDEHFGEIYIEKNQQKIKKIA